MACRRLAGALLCCLAAALSACRKAAVEPYHATVQTTLVAGEPAYLLRPAKEDATPWYRELQVVFDSRPADEKELEALIADRKPVAAQAAQGLLQEVQGAVQGRRVAADKWSVLTLSLGRSGRAVTPRSASETILSAEVALTKLYARRPAITLDSLPLELCVAKLAREAGILHAQPRGYNPLVTWGKTDVSAKEALDEILPAHGFEHRLTDTRHKLGLTLKDFASRAEFVKAAADAIVTAGEALNKGHPLITVSLKEQEPAPEPPAPQPKAPPKRPESPRRGTQQ